MSGLIRLYAALFVATPPRPQQPHPHDIGHAWLWLSRLLNLEPRPDITATILYDFLQVGYTESGNADTLRPGEIS